MVHSVFTYADVEKLGSLRLSKHALTRMMELDIEPQEMLLCVARPEQTWTQYKHGRPQQVMQRGDIGVVMDPNNRTLITILLRTTEEWEHGRHTVQNMPVSS